MEYPAYVVKKASELAAGDRFADTGREVTSVWTTPNGYVLFRCDNGNFPSTARSETPYRVIAPEVANDFESKRAGDLTEGDLLFSGDVVMRTQYRPANNAMLLDFSGNDGNIIEVSAEARYCVKK